jgi:hypothetical protein
VGILLYALNSTKVAEFPLTEKRPLDIAQTLDRLAQELAACSPAALLATASPGMRHSDEKA